MRSMYKIFVGKPDGKRSQGRQCIDGTIILRRILRKCWLGVYCIHVAQERNVELFCSRQIPGVDFGVRGMEPLGSGTRVTQQCKNIHASAVRPLIGVVCCRSQLQLERSDQVCLLDLEFCCAIVLQILPSEITERRIKFQLFVQWPVARLFETRCLLGQSR